MDKEEILNISKRFVDIIRNFYDINKVILFGSYAKGTPNASSDIDLAIFLKEKPDDIIKAETELYKLRRNIDSRIEPLIISEEYDPSGFLLDILDNGIVIFSSE